MEIKIVNSQKDLNIDRNSVPPVVEQVLKLENRICDEVSIHFVTEKNIAALHKKYFDEPTVTDCISFPIDDQGTSYYLVLGDIFICPQTAIKYAEKTGSDPYTETTLYLVHGLLHLLGYDDIDPEDRKKMKSAERKHMKNLQKLETLIRSKG